MMKSLKAGLPYKSIIIAFAICFMMIAEHVCFTNASFPTTRMTLLMMLMFSTVLISRVRIKELFQIPHFLGVIPVFLLMLLKKAIPFSDKLSLVFCAMNLILYGVLLTFGIRRFVSRMKKSHYKSIMPFLKANGLGLTGILMLLFILVSNNEAKWPVYFLIVFLTNCLTQTEDNANTVELPGIINGIIMGFVIIQGHAFVLRPYDEPRYLGFYRNANINAMFYLVVMIALLAVNYHLLEKSAAGWKRLIVLLLICCDFSLCLLAGSRTVIAIMALLMFIGGLIVIIRFRYLKGVTFNKLMINVGELVLVAAVGLVISFSAVRYLPPLFHHPVWFYEEYSENKVHSFDPINSDKYCNPWTTTFGILRRFGYKEMESVSQEDSEKYIQNSDGNVVVRVENYNSDGTVSEENSYDITVARIKERDGQRVISYEDGVEPGIDFEHPVFVAEDYSGLIGKFLRIRTHIFEYYWTESNFFGSDYEWNACWITPTDIYDHAHNNVIEIAYCFGYIPAVLYFAEFVVYAFLFVERRKKHISLSLKELFVLLVMTSVLVLGLTESTSFGFYFIWWIFFYSLNYGIFKKEEREEHNSDDKLSDT